MARVVLKRFSGDTVSCPKCLHVKVFFQYVPQAHPSDLTGEIPSGPEANPEHLIRTCERCGHSWTEFPADTIPPK